MHLMIEVVQDRQLVCRYRPTLGGVLRQHGLWDKLRTIGERMVK